MVMFNNAHDSRGCLGRRRGQALAKAFLDEIIENGNFPVIFIAKDLYEQALDIFKQQIKKGSSVTDCANVAVIRRFHIPTIFSFDKVCPKRFGLELIGIYLNYLPGLPHLNLKELALI
jgi:predicted nucleic acid-binding protein